MSNLTQVTQFTFKILAGKTTIDVLPNETPEVAIVRFFSAGGMDARHIKFHVLDKPDDDGVTHYVTFNVSASDDDNNEIIKNTKNKNSNINNNDQNNFMKTTNAAKVESATVPSKVVAPKAESLPLAPAQGEYGIYVCSQGRALRCNKCNEFFNPCEIGIGFRIRDGTTSTNQNSLDHSFDQLFHQNIGCLEREWLDQLLQSCCNEDSETFDVVGFDDLPDVWKKNIRSVWLKVCNPEHPDVDANPDFVQPLTRADMVLYHGRLEVSLIVERAVASVNHGNSIQVQSKVDGRRVINDSETPTKKQRVISSGDLQLQNQANLHIRLQPAEQPVPCASNVCTYCGQGCSDKYCLQAHMQRLHPNLWTAQLTCSECGLVLKNEIEFKNHANLHLSPAQQPPNMCKYCGRSLSDERALYRHMQKLHPDLWSVQLTCTACGKKFTNTRDLQNHTNLHRLNNR